MITIERLLSLIRLLSTFEIIPSPIEPLIKWHMAINWLMASFTRLLCIILYLHAHVEALVIWILVVNLTLLVFWLLQWPRQSTRTHSLDVILQLLGLKLWLRKTAVLL